MSMKTGRAQVGGLGSAKGGTDHWWGQRISAIALAILTVLFLPPFIAALGAPWETVIATYRSPFNALIAILFIAVGFWHLKLGLQVVIEDYVHGPRAHTTLMILNTLGCVFFGAAGVLAVLILATGS